MEPAPRVLSVELEGDRARARPVAGPASGRWPAARLGGIVEGLRALDEAAARGAPAPLVVAVGEAVRRALPTAARASLLARAPLTGRLALGQIGGELGPRLAPLADALVLAGRCTLSGAVLCVGEAGALELLSLPALVGLAPRAAARALHARFGPAGMLVAGPAGERGVRFASLANEAEHPSFVGRGGLGAVLATLGLKALVVRAAPARVESSPRAQALHAALVRSPRLAERAAGGTLELFAAHAARGELRGAAGEALDPDAGRALAREGAALARERKGCRGCPTPCGWVFERGGGARQQAHFGAAEALGTRLGLGALEDALALVAACDEAGMDAKEAGSVLAVLERARRAGRFPGASALGSRERLLADLALFLAPDAPAFLREGSAAAARALGVPAPLARGEAPGVERGAAAALARAVSTGGADPMRTFPFLLEAGGAARVRALTGLALAPEALDPAAPRDKGRLLWWHENLVAALDASGFCAFSGAGLLADGCATLDELAAWILPEALAREATAWAGAAPGARLLALGASLVLERHALDARYAEPGQGGATLPDAEDVGDGALLAAPGMLAEYRAWRGLDAAGRPRARALARAWTPDAARPPESAADEALPLAAAAPPPAGARAAGALELRAGGALGQALRAGDARGRFELALPCSVREALGTIAARHPALAPALVRAGEPVPSVWRAGARLAPEEAVRAGDVLELVTAIAGG